MNAPLRPVHRHRGRRIGDILIDEGRLSPQDVERVLRLQGKQDIRFGDAVRQLRILSDADIQDALARQFDYPRLTPGQSRLSSELIAAYAPFSPVAENLRTTRSHLMQRWFGANPERRALAIVSAGRGEGRSWLAANLAVVFAQLGGRTLLIDADLRHSRQHNLFGLGSRIGMTAQLSGRGAEDAIQSFPELRDLSILPAGAAAPNPQELLASPAFDELLARVRARYDVVLIDTPAASNYGDAQLLAVRAGAVLVVACDGSSRVTELQRMADDMREAGVQITGSLIRES